MVAFPKRVKLNTSISHYSQYLSNHTNIKQTVSQTLKQLGFENWRKHQCWHIITNLQSVPFCVYLMIVGFYWTLLHIRGFWWVLTPVDFCGFWCLRWISPHICTQCIDNKFAPAVFVHFHWEQCHPIPSFSQCYVFWGVPFFRCKLWDFQTEKIQKLKLVTRQETAAWGE